MSAGDDWTIFVIVIVAGLVHRAITAGIGFVLNRIHRRTLGLVGFMLFYRAREKGIVSMSRRC